MKNLFTKVKKWLAKIPIMRLNKTKIESNPYDLILESAWRSGIGDPFKSPLEYPFGPPPGYLFGRSHEISQTEMELINRAIRR